MRSATARTRAGDPLLGKSEAATAAVSSAKVANPGPSPTSKESAARPPRRDGRQSGRGRIDAGGRQRPSQLGVGVVTEPAGQVGKGGGQHVAGRAARAVEEEDHAGHSTTGAMRDDQVPGDRDGLPPCRGQRAVTGGSHRRRGRGRDALRAASARPASDTIAGMRIAQIAPPWISVPPRGYGGTEWVVQQLCDGLSTRGHDVTLYASGDSSTAAELRAGLPGADPGVHGQPGFRSTTQRVRARRHRLPHRRARLRPRPRPLRLLRRGRVRAAAPAAGPAHRPLGLRRGDERVLRAVRPVGRVQRHQRAPALHGARRHELGGRGPQRDRPERVAFSRRRRTTTCWLSAASARPRASTSRSRWRAAPGAAC